MEKPFMNWLCKGCMSMHVKPNKFRMISVIQGAKVSPKQRTDHKFSKWAGLTLTTGVFVIGLGLVGLFLHLDRQNMISNAIRETGSLGILIAIFLMAAFCIIPVPSEFLMIMNMKVFGVWWGICYTWIGAMLGAVMVFFMARYFGRQILHAFIAEEKLQRVNQWVENRGRMGLLLARLVPLPFIVVNYAAGVLKSVRIWNYIWTTGIGLLPYDLGAALVFIGLSKQYTIWLIVGGAAVIGIWIGGSFFNHRLIKTGHSAH